MGARMREPQVGQVVIADINGWYTIHGYAAEMFHDTYYRRYNGDDKYRVYEISGTTIGLVNKDKHISWVFTFDLVWLPEHQLWVLK